MSTPRLSSTTLALSTFSARIPAVLRRVLRALGAAWREAAHRREVRGLLELDDRMLKDIGLVRSDVVGALAEPLGKDPSVGLRLRTVEARLRQRSREDHVRRLSAVPATDRSRKAAA